MWAYDEYEWTEEEAKALLSHYNKLQYLIFDIAATAYNIRNGTKLEYDDMEDFSFRDDFIHVTGWMPSSCYCGGSCDGDRQIRISFPKKYLWDFDYYLVEKEERHQKFLKDIQNSTERTEKKTQERYNKYLELKQEFEVE